MSERKLTPTFGKRFVYVNNFSQLPKTSAGAKHLVDTLKKEFSAGEYNYGLAGECYATEAEARKRLKHPDDCYFVVEVPAEVVE